MADTNQTTEYLFKGYRLNVQSKTLFDPAGQPVQISHRALDTLAVLLRYRGQTLSKAFLIDAVWPDVFVEENNLNQAITSIRKALGDDKHAKQFIRTFKGKGYCFVAEVTQTGGTGSSEQQITAEAPGDEMGAPWWRPAYSVASIALVLAVVVSWAVTVWKTPETDLPATVQSGVLQATALPGSIAVLPLSVLNPDDENRVLAMGMHLELINRLSRVNDLKLISHNGVPATAIEEQSLTELGRLLNVEYIVTGSILLLDDNARLNLYLLDADTGVILWTDNYEADTDNLNGALPSQIALDIALAMDVQVSDQNRIAVEESVTDSFEAYRYQLAAVSAFTAMDFAKAWSLSKKAMELDPEYLDAVQMYSRVNSVLSSTPLPGMTNADHIQLSLEAAQRSIELAPDNERGYILKAVAFGNGSQWKQAMMELDKLHAMNAPLASLQFLAPILMSLGLFDQAVEILQANLRVEPINLHARGFLLAALEMSGERMQSRLEFELGEELNPEWWGDTVNVFLAMGRDEAITEIAGLTGISNETKQVLQDMADGKLQLVRQALDEYSPAQASDSVELIYYSAIAAYSGNQELAVVLMEDAVSEVGLNIHWAWLPVFDEMRKRDSFKELVGKIGLADYWRENGWPPYCRPVNQSFTCDTGAYDLLSMQ